MKKIIFKFAMLMTRVTFFIVFYTLGDVASYIMMNSF